MPRFRVLHVCVLLQMIPTALETKEIILMAVNILFNLRWKMAFFICSAICCQVHARKRGYHLWGLPDSTRWDTNEWVWTSIASLFRCANSPLSNGCRTWTKGPGNVLRIRSRTPRQGGTKSSSMTIKKVDLYFGQKRCHGHLHQIVKNLQMIILGANEELY